MIFKAFLWGGPLCGWLKLKTILKFKKNLIIFDTWIICYRLNLEILTKSAKIWTFAAVVGGFLVYKVYSIFKSIDIQFSSFDVKNIFSNPKVAARFTILNPSNLSVTISSINGSLYQDGNFLANVATTGDPIKLVQKGLTMVDLNISPTAASVVNFIADTINNNAKEVAFIGSVNLYGIPFPINQTLIL